jgi:pSer/pThr/pTyr-binding forkhead associated (FHA) protein
LVGGKKGPEEGRTIAVDMKKAGIDPVVGWLVCVKGPSRGRDYRIRSGRNGIGRSDAMDVPIAGDDTVSRENHAFLVYEPRKRSFSIRPGDGRGLVYLNGEEVIQASDIKNYDVIELGETQLLFVPLCGEKFHWDQGKEEPADK